VVIFLPRIIVVGLNFDLKRLVRSSFQ
jgi:hypothetical protein